MDRKRRLHELIAAKCAGNQSDFAKLIKRKPTVVWQYLSGHREMGERFARYVESALRLPPGWMDGDGSYPGESLLIDTTSAPAQVRAEMEALAKLASTGAITWDNALLAMRAALAVAGAIAGKRGETEGGSSE